MVTKVKELAWPTPYDGNKANWDAFVSMLKHKLDLDREIMGGNKRAWFRINSCLEQPQQAIVQTKFQQGMEAGSDPSEFVEYLEAIFGDPNRAEKATTKLFAMKQGERQTFIDHVQEFQHVWSDSKMTDDATKLNILKNSINDELKRAIVAMKEPATSDEWAAEVRPVAYKVELLQGPKEHTPRPQDMPRPPPPATDADGDTKMGGTGIHAAGTRPARDVAPWASQEERDRRFRARLCLRCGGEGHYIGACPLKAPAPRAPARKAASGSAPVEKKSEEGGKE